MEFIMKTQGPVLSRYDAVIVGARCAGAATAMLLARAGLRVLAIDRGRYGSDTLSTHALMRAGALQLHRWGLFDRLVATGTPVIRRTSFHYGPETIDIAIKPRDGIAGLMAPRRTALDRRLVDAARNAGAEVAYGCRAIGIVRSSTGRVCGLEVARPGESVRTIRAGIVIGADGMHSAVARLVGAERYLEGRHASANIYGYWTGLESDGYDWYYRPGVSAGAIPTNDGQTCVFASLPSAQFRAEIGEGLETIYDRVLAEAAPEQAERLRRAERVGDVRGFAGQVGFLRRSAGAGWALVGDAGYFKDPLTAHGISDALRDAEWLADAAARGGDDALVGYEVRRDELAREMLALTDAVASFDWDLEQVQRLHLDLSREMNREVEVILGAQPKRENDAA
jgi:2-polyprenyl-6-methoxyphenol hydroxylase-like FAD-dependent oxidoreductase